jgi:hypothetical protein
MSEPDFMKYSLELLREGEVIYRSTEPGLRPLFIALEECRSLAGEGKMTLHDRATGLAAARLIVHSGLIAQIFTRIASRPALTLLADSGITVRAEVIVENILRKDRASICPAEMTALDTEDYDTFIARLQELFRAMQKPDRALP